MKAVSSETIYNESFVLKHLPRVEPVRVSDGKLLYDFTAPPEALFYIDSGRVAISRRNFKEEVVLKICVDSDFFGENVLIDGAGERAQAIQKCTIYAWPLETIVKALANPDAALAMSKELTRKSNEYAVRMQELATQPVCARLASLLLRLAPRGREEENGDREMATIPHKVLAQYVGTSREVVTQCLIRFRKLKLLDYSRTHMLLRLGEIEQFLLGPEGSN